MVIFANIVNEEITMMKPYEINDLFLRTGSQSLVLDALQPKVVPKEVRVKVAKPRRQPPEPVVEKGPSKEELLVLETKQDQEVLERLTKMSLRRGKTGRTNRRLLREKKAEIRRRDRERNKKRVMTDFRRYKDRAWKETNSQPLDTLENFHLRAFNGWHVDHVLSIFEAYKLGLPVETVGHISNLRMIPYGDNLSKNTKTVFTNLFNETV